MRGRHDDRTRPLLAEPADPRPPERTPVASLILGWFATRVELDWLPPT